MSNQRRFDDGWSNSQCTTRDGLTMDVAFVPKHEPERPTSWGSNDSETSNERTCHSPSRDQSSCDRIPKQRWYELECRMGSMLDAALVSYRDNVITIQKQRWFNVGCRRCRRGCAETFRNFPVFGEEFFAAKKKLCNKDETFSALTSTDAKKNRLCINIDRCVVTYSNNTVQPLLVCRRNPLWFNIGWLWLMAAWIGIAWLLWLATLAVEA